MRLPLSSSYPPIHHPSSIHTSITSTLSLSLSLSLSIFISQNPNSQIMASKALPQVFSLSQRVCLCV
ncbi:MAG: hypothetical protein J8272_00655, partial ['Prunus persica' phytoplasma PP2]|nr:hypothetical protein ['Prunus persica' phytoplasma PP2]